MGLDSFKKSNKYHKNNKINKRKLFDPELCPDCGERAEHVRGIEWRCNTDGCDTIYYFDWNTDK